ncbi:MAG: hypothetical protein QXW83_03475 [Nitrososphaerales archaeon]
MSMVKLNSKQIAFIAMMGALGNILAFITIAPTVVKQVALDFSLIPVLIAGIFGGALIGGLTGIIAGLGPSLLFGFIYGQLGFLGFTLSIGKGIVGVMIGLLTNYFKPFQRTTWVFIPLVLVAFIPECFWIILTFSIFVPLFIPSQAALSGFLIPILVKAWFEIGVMSFFISALAGHEGFKSFVFSYMSKTNR